MRCLGCVAPSSDGKKIWRKMLLCGPCHALATKAEAELNRAAETAKERSLQWLEQHVMAGGLHRGGTGLEDI